MAKPMLDALKVLMATGAYKPILSKWYVLSGAITNPQINAAIFWSERRATGELGGGNGPGR